MSETSRGKSRGWLTWLGLGLFVLCFVVAVGLGLLGTSITLRRAESVTRQVIRPIAPGESDSAQWGINYPRQYDRFRRMVESDSKTKFGGSYPRDYLEETPQLVILFAGSGFAKDYLQARGHVWSREDVLHTQRLTPTSPGACWACKSADFPRLLMNISPAELYAKPFAELKAEMKHPIGCLDCHDPSTMKLTISRPALREALQAMGRDLSTISHQEMRSLVCAQCHVEYYFQGAGKYVVFPWEQGTSVEAMEQYYDKRQFADWTHAISKTPLVKLQHPDYELYLTGVHAYRDVACADCHMPYRTEGGVKFTDHHLRSALLNISGSCQVCHRWSEAEILARVESIQGKVRAVRDRVEEELSQLHFEVAAASQVGLSEEELAPVRLSIRRAHFRWDFVAAANGMGFHSPAESLRILADSLYFASQGRREITRLLTSRGVSLPIQVPEVVEKSAAQAVEKAFVAGSPPKLVP
ncbi:MAG: ammonia-forming cytochrome c nitrite reductase subunit c552 [Thermoguttaceae bacterium]|nr:ammonia-forming cytochrome c nitrite reductase subunit c552 [Thermoguttaceae bacterium]MDW8078656.1 ammonia-forming cytochrome c nitrite reductase subunit c552 [Thermoguttaceae bacterium]